MATEWFGSQPSGKRPNGFGTAAINSITFRTGNWPRRGRRTAWCKFRAAATAPSSSRIANYIPVATLSNLVALAGAGAPVIFDGPLPEDVPGLRDLERRRAELKELEARGGARLLNGDLQAGLDAAHIRRETMFDQGGLMCVRRAVNDGAAYFIANRGGEAFEGWLTLATPARTAVLLDPMTGDTGIGALRQDPAGGARVYVQLAPGQSILLRLLAGRGLQTACTQFAHGALRLRLLAGGGPTRRAGRIGRRRRNRCFSAEHGR